MRVFVSRLAGFCDAIFRRLPCGWVDVVISYLEMMGAGLCSRRSPGVVLAVYTDRLKRALCGRFRLACLSVNKRLVAAIRGDRKQRRLDDSTAWKWKAAAGALMCSLHGRCGA